MDKQTLLSYETMSKLCLSEADRDSAVKIISMLEDSFSGITQADTKDIPALISVVELENIMREDISSRFTSREVLLSNAPEEYSGYYQVPKTLE